jgi:hypothetical protein
MKTIRTYRCVGVRRGVRALAGRAPAPHQRPPRGASCADVRRRPPRARDGALRQGVPAQEPGHPGRRVPRDVPAVGGAEGGGGAAGGHLQPAADVAALSQGMETLAETLASAAGCAGGGGGPADSVTNYVGQMAVAMAKLGTLENFLRQVDRVVFFLRTSLYVIEALVMWFRAG